MIAILGGGISGLSAAWYLRKKTQAPIVLLEKSSRLGGWIHSVNRNGFFFEKGPRSLRPQGGEETLRLIQSLGLEGQIVPGEKSAHKRYLYMDQHLCKVPSSLKDLALSPRFWPLLAPLASEWLKPPSPKNDESIYQFISRRLSPRVANTLIDPMTTGIYAGNIHRLSMKSCFPKIYQYEKNFGSITRGVFSQKQKKPKKIKSSLYTLQNGMGEIVKRLADELDIEICLSSAVQELAFDGSVTITTDNKTLKPSRVIAALPSRVLGPLMKPWDLRLSQLLSDIPMASLAVVNIGYSNLSFEKEGFGYLIPSSENEQILGMVWDSSAFPTQNSTPYQTRLSVMIGGVQMTDFEEYSEEDFLSLSLYALKKHCGVTQTPDHVEVAVAKQAIPQYVVGHSARVAEIESRVSALSSKFHILGHCFYGVSVNNCISNAKKLIDSIF